MPLHLTRRPSALRSAAWLTLLGTALSGPAQAVVVSSLPTVGSSDWSDIQFSGTSMVSNGSTTVLTTANSRGVWFGNLDGSNKPSWNLGSATQGNELDLTAHFSSGSADWSAYMGDGQYGTTMIFNPTYCSNSCYGQTPSAGVALYHAISETDRSSTYTFMGLDLTTDHAFSWLLKDGRVAFEIDGSAVFSGYAYQQAWTGLVIGDGSGPTQTGVGSMTISAVRFDTAPTGTVTVSSVPEPGSWALMLAAGAWMLGRRRGAGSGLTSWPRRPRPE